MFEHRLIQRWINGPVRFLFLALMFVAGTVQAKEPPVLVVLGDSLSAGYGLAAQNAFPQKLQRHLTSLGMDVRVENAGVSGDTTADGLARLDWSVGPNADAVIIELGANDGLRGLHPEHAYANLDAILKHFQQRKLPVMLAGMRAPRNLGDEYTSAFDGIYPRLAQKYNVPLYPFFLEGVVNDPKLNQPDMLHPTAEGIDVIVRNIAPQVVEFLNSL
ncbi:MAG: arylesterase [Alphaproteobacteria bacterium]|nr:arylesterase [Alphaproteobacteria bacterium]